MNAKFAVKEAPDASNHRRKEEGGIVSHITLNMTIRHNTLTKLRTNRKNVPAKDTIDGPVERFLPSISQNNLKRSQLNSEWHDSANCDKLYKKRCVYGCRKERTASNQSDQKHSGVPPSMIAEVISDDFLCVYRSKPRSNVVERFFLYVYIAIGFRSSRI